MMEHVTISMALLLLRSIFHWQAGRPRRYLCRLWKGLTILFCYPRSGAPGEKIPAEWDAIPGARGCTPQACSYREKLPDLHRLGVTKIFGLSTQSAAYQLEFKERERLPYDLLSDEKLMFQKAMKLPTFRWQESILTKRVTLAVEDGLVRKVWYPVFPPDENVNQVLEWLQSRPGCNE